MRRDTPQGEQNASLVYPLDTFSMYSRMPAPRESHLLVRDHQGVVHRVTDFRSFDCGGALIATETRCPHGIPYHYDDLARYIESHPGPGEWEIELISRTWELRPGAPPMQTADCVIAHCRVAR